jgi:endonuclease I
MATHLAALRRSAPAGLVRALALLACVPAAWAAPQGPPPGYYDPVDTTDAATLRATLHAVIDDHQRLPYTSAGPDTWDVLELADQDPNDAGRILDVYRNASYAKIGGGNPDYQREHTWPNSYGFPDDGTSNYPYTDCHHLFLCDGGYNSARSNKPFRNCDSACDEKPTLPNDGAGGVGGAYPGDSNWTSGFGTAGTWETWIGRRGDVARALFYMDVRYEGGLHGVSGAAEPDLILTDVEALIAASSTGQNESIAYMGMLTVLLQWHADDPIDAKERDRNDAVFADQGNRNPFVDHPEWVQALWGGGGPGVAGVAWINELHYDNDGADVGEHVEIAGTAGLDLAGWRVVGYNGAGGGEYDAVSLSGVLPDQGGCVGTLDFAFPGLQNGAPDGLALVDALNQVVEFVSYEGVLTATDGPADGLASVDVGVAEDGSTPVGWSLQRVGTGASAGDFAWLGPAPASPGAVNAGQTFDGGCRGTVTPYGCGVNPADSLVVVAGEPRIGTTLTLGVDNPLGTQPALSLPFLSLAFAPSPAYPCGLALPGFGMGGVGAAGELLIDVLSPNPIATLGGPPWTGAGSPAPIAVAIPANPGLVGVTVYAQGLLFDFFGFSEVTFGLTVGAEIEIGP